MDRETALQNYQEAVAGTISEFRSHMEEYLMAHAKDLEQMVREAMILLGKQMEKQKKEYVCFLYFSMLKTDLLNRNYRFFLHALDARWYLDEEPVEVYVDGTELLAPFDRLRDDLEGANRGYGGAISSYDIQTLLFGELSHVDRVICQFLRYLLRDWEEKGIFDPVPRSPYWLLKWGEYRGQTEFLLQTDRVKKAPSAWKEELAKAVHNPEQMVFGYWYQSHCEGKSPREMDLRFITFEECSVKGIAFENCEMEGSRFPGSSISKCSFRGCNLTGADFRRCSFEETTFEGAELAGAIFEAESIPFLEISADQLQKIFVDRGEKA